MSDRPDTTAGGATQVIAEAITSFDGSANPRALATDVLRALISAGYQIVPPRPFNDWGRVG